MNRRRLPETLGDPWGWGQKIKQRFGICECGQKIKLVADEIRSAVRVMPVDRVLRRRLSLRTRQNRGDGGLDSRNRKRCGDDRLAERDEIFVVRWQRNLDDLRRGALHR